MTYNYSVLIINILDCFIKGLYKIIIQFLPLRVHLLLSSAVYYSRKY